MGRSVLQLLVIVSVALAARVAAASQESALSELPSGSVLRFSGQILPKELITEPQSWPRRYRVFYFQNGVVRPNGLGVDLDGTYCTAMFFWPDPPYAMPVVSAAREFRVARKLSGASSGSEVSPPTGWAHLEADQGLIRWVSCWKHDGTTPTGSDLLQAIGQDASGRPRAVLVLPDGQVLQEAVRLGGSALSAVMSPPTAARCP